MITSVIAIPLSIKHFDNLIYNFDSFYWGLCLTPIDFSPPALD